MTFLHEAVIIEVSTQHQPTSISQYL